MNTSRVTPTGSDDKRPSSAPLDLSLIFRIVATNYHDPLLMTTCYHVKMSLALRLLAIFQEPVDRISIS